MYCYVLVNSYRNSRQKNPESDQEWLKRKKGNDINIYTGAHARESQSWLSLMQHIREKYHFSLCWILLEEKCNWIPFTFQKMSTYSITLMFVSETCILNISLMSHISPADQIPWFHLFHCFSLLRCFTFVSWTLFKLANWRIAKQSIWRCFTYSEVHKLSKNLYGKIFFLRYLYLSLASPGKLYTDSLLKFQYTDTRIKFLHVECYSTREI